MYHVVSCSVSRLPSFVLPPARAQLRAAPDPGALGWYRPSVGVPETLDGKPPVVYLFNYFQFSIVQMPVLRLKPASRVLALGYLKMDYAVRVERCVHARRMG